MRTLATDNLFQKPAYTDLLPMRHLVLAEPPADYTIGHLTDDVLLGKVRHIRGQKVMLDRDLAVLYGVKPIRLREQVKRNIARFPEQFMFQLTPSELRDLVSQNAIPSHSHTGGTLPYGFTEHGILMLANVLKSEQAIAVSIRIIDLFVRMREAMLAHKDILLRLEQLEKRIGEHGTDIQSIFEYLKQLLAPPSEPRKPIGFKP
ncbi:MAG: ORF6N domain-containing protein [Flavobacteriales bacterium]|nr:ORF6N domain-containing protein [Flavobacteriales bacterium]